jgi:predicted NAD/FAD-binding protein
MNLLNDYLNKIAGYQVVRLNTKVNIPTPLAENRKPVLLIDDEKYHFRKIVISTHADDAIHLFERGDFIPEEIISVLTRIQYSASTIVAHTSTNTFQPNYNSWRTYNIHIYDFKHGQTGPYTISYVVNRHQNDMANPQFHTIAQLPLFFLTVNPIEFPPESCILKTTSDELAIRRYKHQVLNFDLMDAQEKYLPRIQGKYGIFYCGGYGKGAGLHDQCWFFGKEIAQILAYHNFCEI